MLPKTNRLTKKKDFDLVFKKGKNIKSDFLMFKLLENNLKENRFGFIVSKKISSKATVRNRVKRRLRKAVFEALKTLILHPKNKEVKYVDLVIIALSDVKNKEFLEIQEKINNFFGKQYV
jgi:ribonuclease P protein component